MEPAASLLTSNGSYFRHDAHSAKERTPLQCARRQEFEAVVLINDTFARKYFPNEIRSVGSCRSAEGRRPAARDSSGSSEPAKHGNLAEPDEAEFYLPFSQSPDRYSDIVVADDGSRIRPVWRQ
jgi:hypothetical protein